MGLVISPHPAPLRREECQFVIASDQLGPVGGRLGVDRPQGDGLPHPHRFLFAFEQHGLTLAEPDSAARQFGRQPSAEHFSGRRHLLQTGGHVDRVPDHGDFVGPADRRRHHLAGIDPDRERQVTSERSDGQAGGDSAFSVVVMGHGDPEHRHHRVAHVFVDGAAVVGHDLGQLAEGRIHDTGHDFGVRPLGERREADDIGEQDGRQFAFLDRWRRHSDGGIVERLSAVSAEPLALGVGGPARRACGCAELRSTVTAEQVPVGIGGLAAGADRHCPST